MSEDIISWTNQGTAFIVYNQDLLEKNVLQNYFKHSNYSSFVRQLNLYNFKKVKSNEGFIFRNNFFRKGTKSMLQLIKKRNQEDSAIQFAVQGEHASRQKQEQNLFKECAIDIKQTNTNLKEDMKLLQETSSCLIDQMQNLNYVIYNQNVDIELKFKQVGQMLQAINEELKSEKQSDSQTLNQSLVRKEDCYQDSKVGSPNPYVDYNSTALNPLDYECFLDSFF
ncbi:unnamed protein product (macronuclear) [Paramecium tetraurelia]|uniref:HSF-type DNA-binding domain-containing protein n=1 Tax=Paramecium tetraurelia TaxID=5888 RepID=A0BB20_PARTE|nr:uncharacterized protein GSPATT00000172001 [Paramecium tetraurelia]CAK55737.1 unnamed protein product [Paramecium tetraurelia]|eukprot:XP_001423135.1 hypothetical protein (macronuclear) [Paramecium tetraurelia strain d4-2]